jgi:hypothetical protein
MRPLRIGTIGSRHLGFDPLHHASTGAALARSLDNALAARQRCADCLFFRCVNPRPADRLTAFGALLSRPGKPGVDPFLNDRTLELCKYAKHLAIRMIDPNVALSTVWASKGKVTRAEPVSALYEQGRMPTRACSGEPECLAGGQL